MVLASELLQVPSNGIYPSHFNSVSSCDVFLSRQKPTIILVPGGMLLIAGIFLKETPRWLFKVGREEEAIKNLAWIRNLSPSHEYVQQEIQGTRCQLDRETALARDHGFMGQVRELGKPGIRNRLGVGMAIMMFQNLTGMYLGF